MKKLLTIFATLTLGATTSLLVVSCTTNPQEKDNDENESIPIDILANFDLGNLEAKVFAGWTREIVKSYIQQYLSHIVAAPDYEIVFDFETSVATRADEGDQTIVQLGDKVNISATRDAYFLSGSTQLVAVIPDVNDLLTQEYFSPSTTVAQFKNNIYETLAPFINSRDDVVLDIKSAKGSLVPDDYELQVNDIVTVTTTANIQTKLTGQLTYTIHKYDLSTMVMLQNARQIVEAQFNFEVNPVESNYGVVSEFLSDFALKTDYLIEIRTKDNVLIEDAQNLAIGDTISVTAVETSRLLTGKITYTITKVDLRRLMVEAPNLFGESWGPRKEEFHQILSGAWNANLGVDYSITLVTKGGGSLSDDYIFVDGDEIHITGLASSAKLQANSAVLKAIDLENHTQ